VVITPQVGQYHWADFTVADKIIAAGREAAEAALPAIHDLLRRTRGTFWKRFF
jgi:predicted acylesterase/phospholipase RssA